MTSSLRDALVEAGAIKLYELDDGFPEIWDNIGDEPCSAHCEVYDCP